MEILRALFLIVTLVFGARLLGALMRLPNESPENRERIIILATGITSAAMAGALFAMEGQGLIGIVITSVIAFSLVWQCFFGKWKRRW